MSANLRYGVAHLATHQPAAPARRCRNTEHAHSCPATGPFCWPDRDETDPCDRGTPGCASDHPTPDSECECY